MPPDAFPGPLAASWTEEAAAARVTPARSGHVTLRAAPGRLLLFGGYAEPAPPTARAAVNDLWEWAPRLGWRALELAAAPPRPRLVAAVATVNGKPHMFGGWDPTGAGTILDTVHRFDAERNAWGNVGVSLPGGAASRHVCLSLPDGRALFHNHRCVGFVCTFDGESFEEVHTTGDGPSSRGLHAATMLGEKRALFFGGVAQDGTMSNEVFVLDVGAWRWQRLDVSGNGDVAMPSPRAAACLCAFDERRAILYGGASYASKTSGLSGLVPHGQVWTLAVDDRYERGQWELLDVPGAPRGRNAATLDLVSDDRQGSKEYLLAGGWAPFKETYNDNFVLKISERDEVAERTRSCLKHADARGKK